MRTRRRSIEKLPVTQSGFSLIETLVVLALLGILVAMAYPSFANSLAKARRMDGRVAVLELQLAQERWRSSHAQFGDHRALNSPAQSAAGHYRLRIVSADDRGFSIEANAQGAQSADTPCRVLRLTRLDGHTTLASGADAQAANPADLNRRCWNP